MTDRRHIARSGDVGRRALDRALAAESYVYRCIEMTLGSGVPRNREHLREYALRDFEWRPVLLRAEAAVSAAGEAREAFVMPAPCVLEEA